jgi:hypothetical protein
VALALPHKLKNGVVVGEIRVITSMRSSLFPIAELERKVLVGAVMFFPLN